MAFLCVVLLSGLSLLQAASSSKPNAADDLGRDELQVGQLYETAGRWAEAEAAYRKALADGSPATRQPALAALERVLKQSNEAGPLIQLKAGEALERAGLMAEAQLAYSKALESGPPAWRADAFRRLTNIVAQPRASGALLDLAKAYEGEDRFRDAETVYAKLLESGPAGVRAEARQRLHALIKRQSGFYQTQLAPVLELGLKSLTTAVVLLVSLAVIGYPLKWYGRRRGRNALSIATSWPTSGTNTTGSGFGETLAAMHERMAVHFRPRGILRDRTMPVLVSSQSTELVKLVSVINSSAGPVAEWLTGVVRQPAFRISGSAQATDQAVRIYAKLERSGRTIQRWSRVYALPGWFAGEQDLAYEILIRLKEYLDAHAS